jgi:hypothetical protein
MTMTWLSFEQADARRIAALARVDQAAVDYGIALFEAMTAAEQAAEEFPGTADFLPPGYSGRGLAKLALGALKAAAPALRIDAPTPAGSLAIVGAEQSALICKLHAAAEAANSPRKETKMDDLNLEKLTPEQRQRVRDAAVNLGLDRSLARMNAEDAAKKAAEALVAARNRITYPLERFEADAASMRADIETRIAAMRKPVDELEQALRDAEREHAEAEAALAAARAAEAEFEQQGSAA